MIPYVNSSFGLRMLPRVHGSALYKSLLPALISTAIYFTIVTVTEGANMYEVFIHPYPMQALVTAFTFLLVFRANYSYNRWWEAYTAVYLMHSKWLDLATEIAAFHYQSKRYDEYKPPSFGANPGVQSLDHHSSEFLAGSFSSNWNMSTRDESKSSGFGANAAAHAATSSTGSGDVLTPPPSPKKHSHRTKHSPMHSTPNARRRHAKQPTLVEITQQMDALEAEEEEMNKRQSLTVVESKESEDDSDDNDDIFADSDNSVDAALSTIGEGETSPKKKVSWLSKIKERRSDAKAGRKAKKVDHSRDGLPVHLDAVEGQDSDKVDVSTSQQRRRQRRERQKRRRSRHQPATARLFNQRKMIARGKESALPHEEQLEFRDRFDIKTGKPYSVFTAYSRKHLREGNLDPDDIPPLLFLEECAHLLSLMSAVAFSTLRNDLPEAESPLTVFEPGLPWPLVDPDGYKSKVRIGWTRSKYRIYAALQFALGRSRNDKARTLYNAARPFRVIGNVSDAEIEKLQQARGPLAKVSLISMWLLELISREYQAGSTGNVAPPIISRLYQFVSEGLAGYNQARKIAYIPFPFPHAQITTLYLGVVDFFVTPLLMTTFVSDVTLGCFLNLFSVLCFTGLHEVAREIENPFQNVPNDVPLNNYQAQFNEALMVMFYGYHPDSYWNGKEKNSNNFTSTTPSSENNFKSPKASPSATSDINKKAFQVARDSSLTSSQPLRQNEPVRFPVGGKDQDGFGLSGSTNSRSINRPSDPSKSTTDQSADDLFRSLIGGRLSPFSATDSFQKVPSENDSIRDHSGGTTSSPVEFRIPQRTQNFPAGSQPPSDEDNTSPTLLSESVEENKLISRSRSSDF